MVKMGVGENDGVDFPGRNRQVLPVAFAPLFLTLEEPTVHQYLDTAFATFIAGVDQVLRSGDDSCCPQKLDVDQASLFCALVARLRSNTFVASDRAYWQVPD